MKQYNVLSKMYTRVLKNEWRRLFIFCIFLLICIESCSSLVQTEPELDFENICNLHLSQGCPVHDSDSWRCAKVLTSCSGDQFNRYHCVRNSTEQHFKVMHICAPLMKCVKGTIPIYDRMKNVISCKPCPDGYYQPDDVWSDETPECLQKHTCEKEGNKIECDMGTGLRNIHDTYCRCDARNNYVLTDWEHRGKCVEWAHAACYLHPCPDGQERLSNYSCALQCPQGQKRDDNDICVPIGIDTVTKAVKGTPRAPGEIEILGLTSRNVTVRWQHSLGDGNSPITAYIVTIKSKGHLWEDGQVYEVSSNADHIIIKDLQPNSAYQVQVRARNAIGLSPPSSSSEILTLAESTPRAPGEIEILGLTSRNVTVRWQHSLGDGNSPITAYIVTIKSEGFFSDDGQIYEVSSNTSYIVIKDLRPNTAYQVRVSAKNAIGFSPPSSPSKIFFTLPERPTSAPLQLAARSVENDRIEISWKAPPPDTINGVLQGYDIQYGILVENVSTTIAVDGTKESVVIHGLKPFTKYRISVRAFNEASRGPAAFTYVQTKEERITDHTTTSINQDQDMQTTGIIDHTTRSVNHEKSTDSSFIRYLLYIIPGTGLIVVVGLCLLRKFKCWSFADGTSNTNLHSDSNINSEHENHPQHYWTIVTNARGDVFSAHDMDISMELDENISRSTELEAYIHPSEPVEHEGYINPIHSEHDGYIDPIHSEPVEHHVYIDHMP